MKIFFEYILDHPKKIVTFFIFFSLFSIFYSFEFLKIDTSTENLISNKLNFKKNQQNLKKTFEVLNNNILVRVKFKDGNNELGLVESIQSNLESSDFTSFVYSPSTDEVFKENFFLFLNDSEKESIVKKLYNFQPFLTEINNHENRLNGFNNLLELSIKDGLKNIDEFEKVFDTFSESLKKNKSVNWKNFLSSSEGDFFILFGIKASYLEKNSFINIYKFLENLKLNESDKIKIDFTGGLLIDYEEVESVASGAILSGLLSFFLVGILLWIAFRNFLVIFSILITILAGLSITIFFTTIFIGSLNLISVAFAVLFIGLSVDYGIQVCSRLSETESKILANNQDSRSRLFSISKILVVASIPSVIGFISFIPTNYIGLSELGIISAIGLIVGLVLNISLLPALIKIFSKKLEINFHKSKKIKFTKIIFKFQNYILSVFVLISLFTLLNLKKIEFDSDALNLKDQNLQSVKLAKDLLEKNPTSDYIASVIFDQNELKNFDKNHLIFEDSNVKTFFSYQKIFQKYESDEFEYLKFLLRNTSKTTNANQTNQVKRLIKLLNIISENKLDKISIKAEELKSIILDMKNLEQQSEVINNLLFEDFDKLISFIINIDKIPDNLSERIPKNFRDRYISADNLERVEFFPAKDLSIPKNLKDFALSIEKQFPNATGMPIVQFNAGNIVIESFTKALTISITFLSFFLIIIFRNLKFVLLSISSLFIASILTIFFMIILGINFNFANMIAIPLIFSLGISYPIYLIRRFEDFGDIDLIFESNTPFAILFSGLTTIFSFSTLYLSTHDGTSSMGLLLFISLSNTLVSSLVFLPIFLKKIRTE